MRPINMTSWYLFKGWELEDFEATPLVCSTNELIDYSSQKLAKERCFRYNKIPYEDEKLIDNYIDKLLQK